MNNPTPAIPEYFESRFQYRLFASVDIAGSTEYKQQERAEWARVFEQFFRDFPPLLNAALDDLSDDLPGCPSDPMRVWKYVGDEILFVAEIGDHRQCMYHAKCLMSAIDEYEPQLSKQSPLALKGAMWTAGFPLSNRRIRLRQNDDMVEDYLGPDIDLGFRIATNADPRRVPVNVQLAHLLAVASGGAASPEAKQCAPSLQYERSVRLKGILRGAPYPLFWLDRRRGVRTPEDKLLGRSRETNLDHAREFIEHLFNTYPDHIERPFIEGDAYLGEVPQDKREKLAELLGDDSDYQYERAVSDTAMAQSDAVSRGELPRVPESLPRT